MLPYINIFGVAFPLPALIILVGIWVGISVAERYSNRNEIDPSHIYNLTLYTLIAGIIGARLAFVAQFPTAFVENPSSLISPNPGLFDLSGGIAVGLITALIYIQRNKLAFWPLFDSLTPIFAVAGISLSLSNFASGNAYGSTTSLPWGIELWGAVRHPSQIYEALAAGIILWLIWPGRIKRKSKPGKFFLQFTAYSAIERLFFEAFRGDSLLTVYGLRAMQIAAWVVLALSLWGLSSMMKEQGTTKKNPVK